MTPQNPAPSVTIPSNAAVPTIAKRNKWQTERRNVAVGDMVYVANDTNSNAVGQLEKVINVYPDSKGLVRSVRLRVKDNELVRPSRQTEAVFAR